jgi:hypothetical protein
VSSGGIDHGKTKPKAEAVSLILSGEPIRRPQAAELVSPDGIEPLAARFSNTVEGVSFNGARGLISLSLYSW